MKIQEVVTNTKYRLTVVKCNANRKFYPIKRVRKILKVYLSVIHEVRGLEIENNQNTFN